MFYLNRQKLIHCAVIASVIFGCSVQAATPSFQEDLDDFEEIQLVDQTLVVAERFEPLNILWHNEDLAQTLIVTNTLVDDIELINISLGRSIHFLFASVDFNYYFSSLLRVDPSCSCQARAPPLFS
jgi:hypothetical protein